MIYFIGALVLFLAFAYLVAFAVHKIVGAYIAKEKNHD